MNNAHRYMAFLRLLPSAALPLLLLLALVMFPRLAFAQQDNGPIILGQSCALSGPAKNLGLEMRAGLLAAFAFINDLGGIGVKQVHLISLDDGYEPDKAVKNTIRLISEDDVFLLIGEVGTPTSKAVIPIIEEYKIPFFAPFTGAELLREPFRRYVINVRASYYQEMEELASYLSRQTSCAFAARCRFAADACWETRPEPDTTNGRQVACLRLDDIDTVGASA